MKILVDYPTPGEEAAIVGRAIREPAATGERLHVEDLLRYRQVVSRVFVDRTVIAYAVDLADATRRPERFGLDDLREQLDYGASPRGPIGLIQTAQALALLRGRRYAMAGDVRDLAADVLRHRLVLSYDALSDGVTPDEILEQVIAAVDAPEIEGPPLEEEEAAA
jgi:MoxR-like ATPase